MHCKNPIRFAFIASAFVAALAPSDPARGQEVHVFDEAPAQNGNTIIKTANSDTDARLLVIPVVTADSPFDPNNNLLNAYNPANPNLRQDIIDKVAEANGFWREASYGQVGVEATVLDRYYQMPLGQDAYVNPTYQDVTATGSAIGFPVDPPAGQFQIDVHISDSDSTTYTIQFVAGDGPFTSGQLETHVSDAISTSTTFDKVAVSVTGGALEFLMGERHVRAGSYIRINESGSDADVLDALGLDSPVVDLAATELTARGGAFPVGVATNASLTVTLSYADGSDEDFVWTVPGGSNFNDASALVAAHGADLVNASITVAGDELQFDLTPGQPDPVAAITASETGPWDLDDLGLDRVVLQEGLVTKRKTNTVKDGRNLIAGQAVAAFMMNELTRVDAGADAIPNIAFDAANAADLTQAFQENADYDGMPDRPYNSYVVVFLDITGKRAGAAGGFIDAGVENGGYLFTHQLNGKVQIIYQATGAGTVAHETGHNFGFPDLYDNSSGNYDPNLRYANHWDIMDQSVLNHPGAWVKGFDSNWIQNDGGNIEVFPMPATPGVESRKYALTPLEFGTAAYDDMLAGLPGDIDAVAKAVRLPIGFDPGANHHFMFLQNRQQGQSYSTTLPMVPGAPNSGGVYLTDTISKKVFDYFTITTRNYVHPLTDAPDVFVGPTPNVRPILDAAPAGDVNLLMTYPAYAGLDIDIVDTIPGPGGLANRPTYIVEIDREQSDFLDLAISPWNAPPYESVDIWIEHGDKDLADLSTVPLAGNGEPARWADNYDPAANGGKPLNWVRVQVTNNGTVDATDVQVKVKVNTPGAMGASGSWAELDLSEALAVTAGGSTIFNVPWNPKVKGHTCVQAEIFRWTSALGEVDFTNNGTQENVNDFQPTAGSPWHPAPFSVDVENPFDDALDIYLEAEGLRPGFSVKWDRSHFTVPPHSKTRRSGVLLIDEDIVPTPDPDGAGGVAYYEYVCDPVATGAASLEQPDCRKVRTKPIRMLMNVVGYADAGDYRVPIGGVTYDVKPTIATDIDVDIEPRGDAVRVSGKTTPVAANQDMEIEVRYPSGRFVWLPVTTDAEGAFGASFVPEEDGSVGIAVNYPEGGDFAAVKVDGRLFVPGKTGVIPENGFCLSCTVQSVFWIVTLVLLVAILLIVLVLWHAIRGRRV